MKLLLFALFPIILWNYLSADHVEGEIIIRFVDDAAGNEKNKTAVRFDLTLKKSFKLTNSGLYSFDSNRSLSDLKKALEQIDCVKYVSYNKIYRKQSNDPYFQYQWYLENRGQSVNYFSGTAGNDIGWKTALSRYSKKLDTYVAVLDSGFAKDHPELRGKSLVTILENNGVTGVDEDGNGYMDDILGWDFVDNDNDPYDFKGHGTQVAGIISSNQDGVGVQGISEDAYIKPIRVLNRDGTGSTAKLAEALEYIHANSAFRIINISLGGVSYDPILEETIKAFEQDDRILIVCASGNGGSDGKGDSNDQIPFYPSSFDSNSVISVASINQTGSLSVFSNYGKDSVDIAAPGENIAVATIIRELIKEDLSNGIGWEETMPWVYSISKSWNRKLYGSKYWLESPRQFTYMSKLNGPIIDLKGTKDPRLKLHVDFSLFGGGIMYVHVSDDFQNWRQVKTFSDYSTNGPQKFDIDVSDFAGLDVFIKFLYYPNASSSSFFDIGGIEVWDVKTNGNGIPYYEYTQGTSFSAPIVSGVASLIMSHRPDLLASDVKQIMMDSVMKLNSLTRKVKSGGTVRADKALELADTYARRSSVTFAPIEGQAFKDGYKIRVVDAYLNGRELTAGEIRGAGHYFEGDQVTLTATPGLGFVFEGWKVNGQTVSSKLTHTFTSGFKNYIFTAHFTEDMADPDNDQFPNYAEVVYSTNINNPNSDGDGLGDYEEVAVSWRAYSLSPTVNDSSTISFLEGILGANSYELGKVDGQNIVSATPHLFGLFSQRDLNASIANAIKEGEAKGIEAVKGLPNQYGLYTSLELLGAKDLGFSEGKNKVIDDPESFSLVDISLHNQALEDANISATQAIFDARISSKAKGLEEGKVIGKSEGISLVKLNPNAYDLVSKYDHDLALTDANASATRAIHEASISSGANGVEAGKRIGRVEGISFVTSNPSSYNLVSKEEYNKEMNELIAAAASDANATPYTEGWFYMPDMGWLWTSQSEYPYFYDSSAEEWLYFESGNVKPKFYLYLRETQTWIRLNKS